MNYRAASPAFYIFYKGRKRGNLRGIHHPAPGLSAEGKRKRDRENHEGRKEITASSGVSIFGQLPSPDGSDPIEISMSVAPSRLVEGYSYPPNPWIYF
jgi:hypothetical protein